jgi:phenylpropionate dioxygenase-like ring-hydroxylating dioxygenase large terminal subunit
MTTDAPLGAGWFPLVPSASVRDVPVEAEAGGVRWVAYRPTPGGAAAVVEARCPHRLVRLAHGTLVEGRLRCAYHGWEFDPDGACAVVPSNGTDAAVPSRAHLRTPWGVREHEGTVWVAPGEPGGAPARPDTRAEDDLLTNLDPGLRPGWHPAALLREVPNDGEPRAVRLLGNELRVRRAEGGALLVDPVPAAVAERFGLLWVALDEPRFALIDVPEDDDPAFAQGWLEPERSGSPAGVLAENFLDVAHFPFVHAGTFGAAEERYVPPLDVERTDGGLTSVQEQWFDNPGDPGVATGVRPLRQRRRATYSYRWPFQLSLRLEELDAGAVKTILFVLQPEDLDSTRIYTKMLLHGIGGVAVPPPDVVAAEVAFEVAVLAEDLRLQQAMTVRGLPLRLRDELHVRSDRSGVALRRVLADFRTTTA